MTVRELIDELQKMPQDLPVIDMGEPVNGCHVVHDHPDGDPARPGGCPIIDAVYLD